MISIEDSIDVFGRVLWLHTTVPHLVSRLQGVLTAKGITQPIDPLGRGGFLSLTHPTPRIGWGGF